MRVIWAIRKKRGTSYAREKVQRRTDHWGAEGSRSRDTGAVINHLSIFTFSFRTLSMDTKYCAAVDCFIRAHVHGAIPDAHPPVKVNGIRRPAPVRARVDAG